MSSAAGAAGAAGAAAAAVASPPADSGRSNKVQPFRSQREGREGVNSQPRASCWWCQAKSSVRQERWNSYSNTVHVSCKRETFVSKSPTHTPFQQVLPCSFLLETNQEASFCCYFLNTAIKTSEKLNKTRRTLKKIQQQWWRSNKMTTATTQGISRQGDKAFKKRGNKLHKLPTTKQVHNTSRVSFGWGCGWEEGGRGAEDICWGGQSGQHINHRLWIIRVHICQLLMQPMQFMQEGEGRHLRAQEVWEELKRSNFFPLYHCLKGVKNKSRTADRSIGDTGPPTRTSGSLEEITKWNPPPSDSVLCVHPQ